MWITAYDEKLKNEIFNGAIVFEKHFRVGEKVKKAVLYVSALGAFDWSLNNEFSNDYFMPGWTNYSKEVHLCEYDVSNALHADNLLTITVAKGWYAGRLGYIAKGEIYGKTPAIYAKIIIEYHNGESETIESDASWTCGESHIVFADFFDGEHIDFNKKTLKKYETIKTDVQAVFKKYDYEPVQIIEKITPTVISSDENGITYDFGKNIAGVIKFFAKGLPLTEITVRYAEILDKNGEIYTENLRSAKATDKLRLGEKDCAFDPKFTFHGFRYARLEWSEECEITDLIGLVLSQNLERTGFFESENELANKIYRNILNGQAGNFISIPTDCPQRDERIGWTGDAQIFCDTAFYNSDCNLFFKNYIEMLNNACYDDGRVPVFVPFFTKESPETTAAPAWSDAITILPMKHYLFYGDKSIVTMCLPQAEKWVKYFLNAEKNGFPPNEIFNYGDWLSAGEETDKTVVAYAYLGISLKNLSDMFKIVGDENSAKIYENLRSDMKKRFFEKCVSGSTVSGDTQTAYLLSYAAGFMTGEEIRSGLIRAIERRNGHLSTGFLGLRFLLPTLCDIGETEKAYDILLQTTYPSWGYETERGATTIWERWDGIKEDGEIFDPSMNSFNHYSLGSVGYWYYAYVLGIKVELGGIKISPCFTDRLGKVKGSFSFRGNKITAGWQKKGEVYEYTIFSEKPLDMKFDFKNVEITNKKDIDSGAVFTLMPIKKCR